MPIKPELKSLSETSHHFATVLPLDYQEGRLEHAVLFFSSSWSDLVDLITDPYEFMLKMQDEFGAERGSLKWLIRTPVTAIIRPGASRPRSVINMKTFAAHAFAAQNNLDSVDVTTNPTPHTFDELLEAVTANGGFYAEFAICTSVLTIYYWPPTEDKPNQFTGELTRGVLGYISGAESLRTGTLHFDLAHKEGQPEKPMARHRADFIVECLQSRQIDDRLQAINIEVGNTSLFEPKDGIRIPAVAQARLAREQGFSFMRTTDRLPTIHVERLSEDTKKDSVTNGGATIADTVPPADCTACCNAQVSEDPTTPGRFLIGDVIVKCYFPCPDSIIH